MNSFNSSKPGPGQQIDADREFSTDRTKIFDTEHALSRAGGDVEIARMIAKMFVEQADSALIQMHDAAATGEIETLQRLAHTMKTSADNVGCPQVRAAALRLETAAANRASRYAEWIQSLQLCLTAVLPRVREFATEGLTLDHP